MILVQPACNLEHETMAMLLTPVPSPTTIRTSTAAEHRSTLAPSAPTCLCSESLEHSGIHPHCLTPCCLSLRLSLPLTMTSHERGHVDIWPLLL